MSFHIGQKVVRIGSGKLPNAYQKRDFSFPAVGEVCTIRTINDWQNVTLITLEEYDNSHIMRRDRLRFEPGFDASKFRPVHERKTDISIFTAMLTKHPEVVK